MSFSTSSRRPAGGHVGRLAGFVVALLGLAGCASGEVSAAPSDNSAGEWALEQALEGGASDEQLAILQGGEVAFGQYQAAVGRTLACMREAGIEVFDDAVTQSRGFPEIAYSFGSSSAGRSDDQTYAIADECLTTHSMWVEAAYQLQPSSVEQQEAGFAPYRDGIVQCVRENGGELPEEATMGDILSADLRVEIETGIGCARESGYGG